MSQHIRVGNTYVHDDHGLVLTTHHDDHNEVWFRTVESLDNGGVMSTSEAVYTEPYREFLGHVRMRDYPDDENWSRLRKYVFHRDNGVCQGCGTDVDRSAPIHHICPLGCGGTNSPSNLLLLCEECHGNVHRGPI